MILQSAQTQNTPEVFDVIGLGELMVEFNEVDGNSDNDIKYHQSIGGDVYNTLYALSKTTRATSFVSAIGNDIFKEFMLLEMGKYNVDIQALGLDLDYYNGVYFIKITPDQNRIIQSYRERSAARFVLNDYSFPKIIEFCTKAKIFYFTGISLAVTEQKDLLIQLVKELKAKNVTIVYDTNVRPQLWRGNLEGERKCEEEYLPFVDLIFLTKDDSFLELGVETLDEVLKYYRAFQNIKHIIVKDGANGATYYGNGLEEHVDARTDVKVIDTTGAGDAFNGGFLSGYLQGKDPKESLHMGVDLATACIQVKGALNYA